MSNLTDLLPAGAGGKQVDFVASGTLSSGQTVALKANGDVEAVQETTYANTNLGSKTSAFYENSKVAMAYIDNAQSVISIGRGISNYYLQGRVTYLDSNRNFQFGSNTVIDSSVGLDQIGVGSFLNSKKFIVLFRANFTGSTKIRVCENTSGGTISVGTDYGFFSGAGGINGSEYPQAIGISDTKILCSTWGGTGGGMVVGVVDISSGTPVIGTVLQPTGSTRQANSLARTSDPNKFIASWNNSGQIYACVVTVSGTSVSFGAVVNTSLSSVAYYSRCCYDAVNDQVLFVAPQTSTASIILVTGSVSGTTLTLSTNVQTAGIPADNPNGTFEAPTTLVSLSQNLFGVFYGYYASGVAVRTNGISYFSMSGATANNYSNRNVGGKGYTCSMAYSEYQDAVFYTTEDQASSPYDFSTYASDYPHTITNSTDFIGITDAAISDTASGSVTIKGGISTNVTGLTPNQNYYVQDDGTLATTSSTVLAGKALSSTSINLDYTT